MNMQGHILAALKELYGSWEELTDRLTDEQLAAPLLPSEWTVKDEMAHLWAWQQRSIARLEAALAGQAPSFPVWLPDHDPNEESNTEAVNGWIYCTYRDQPWSAVHNKWRKGFSRLLELGKVVSEVELLDSSRYPWMEGYPLAFVLLGTYDHHKEHYDHLSAWLDDHPSEG